MYAIVLRFHVVAPGPAPSIEVLGESIRRVRHHDGRVEHVTVARRTPYLIATVFVTAPDADRARLLGHRAAIAVELTTSALRLVSVKLLDRLPKRT